MTDTDIADEPDDIGGECGPPPDLVELYEVLEWQTAVEAGEAET